VQVRMIFYRGYGDETLTLRKIKGITMISNHTSEYNRIIGGVNNLQIIR